MIQSRDTHTTLGLQQSARPTLMPAKQSSTFNQELSGYTSERISDVMRQAAEASGPGLQLKIPKTRNARSTSRLTHYLRRPKVACDDIAVSPLITPYTQVCAQTGMALLLGALTADCAPCGEENVAALKQLLERYFLRQQAAPQRVQLILKHAQMIAERYHLHQTAALAHALLQRRNQDAPERVLHNARALVTPARRPLWTYMSSQARWQGARYALFAPVDTRTAEQVRWLVQCASRTLRSPLQARASQILGDITLSYAQQLARLNDLKAAASWTDDGRRALGLCIKILSRAQAADAGTQAQALTRAHLFLRRPQQAFDLADQLDHLGEYLNEQPAQDIDAHVLLSYETLLTQAALTRLPQTMFTGWHTFAQSVMAQITSTTPEMQSLLFTPLEDRPASADKGKRADNTCARVFALSQALAKCPTNTEALLEQIAQLLRIAPLWIRSWPQNKQDIMQATLATHVDKYSQFPLTQASASSSAFVSNAQRGSVPHLSRSTLTPTQASRFCHNSFALAYLYADMQSTMQIELPLQHLMLGAAFEGVYAGQATLAARVWSMQVALGAHSLVEAPAEPPSYASWWTQMQPDIYLTAAHKQAIEQMASHLEEARQSVLS